MSVEVLLLALLGGVTILAYMIAINSHGPTRLSISYLFATILLAGTVWAIVQHVNVGLDREKMEELKRLELEKKRAEERIKSQEQALRVNKKISSFAATLNSDINTGTGLATTMMNVDLRDINYEIDVLIGRASQTRKKTQELQKRVETLQPLQGHFSQSISTLQEAADLLEEAGKYYYLFYRSEDTAQEELRERIMRQKAREAYENFQKATQLVASST